MTPEQLDALEAEAQYGLDSGSAMPPDITDADLAALIAEVRRLQAENERLRAAARAVSEELNRRGIIVRTLDTPEAALAVGDE